MEENNIEKEEVKVDKIKPRIIEEEMKEAYVNYITENDR